MIDIKIDKCIRLCNDYAITVAISIKLPRTRTIVMLRDQITAILMMITIASRKSNIKRNLKQRLI